jgi:hypothetical protein
MGSSTTSVVSTPTPLASSVAVDTASDATVNQLKASACKVHALVVNNSAGAQDVYVELWDLLGASVTIGTTIPTLWWLCKAGKRLVLSLRNLTDKDGLTFSTGLTMATVTSPGGNTSPAVKPTVECRFS